MKESDEFLILQKYFKNLGSQYNDSSGIIVGPGDDAGLFSTNKLDLIFSTDVSNSNIHFPKSLKPELIAYRACSVAASDIPACGGTLKWLSISLVSPTTDLAWLKKFAEGLKLFTSDYKVPVIGGDLIKGRECSVSVGVCGEVNKKDFLSRGGAQEDDLIFISGTLGEARLGLKVLSSKKKNLSKEEKKYLKKFLKPKVHTSLGKNLQNIATSCIDISDGLLGDLGHICNQSNKGAEINIESIPHAGPFQDALTWGDDYELCFTAPTNREKEINNLAKSLKIKINKIGKITNTRGIKFYNGEKRVHLKQTSYNHFKK
ncbi:MAG: thiamine-phosphate kinase [Gammaproteobacteria bacterium]|tara:strand:- start:6128 stop:7078 length:951 start_codon:yes stop_codon:yes gene_type:complete